MNFVLREAAMARSVHVLLADACQTQMRKGDIYYSILMELSMCILPGMPVWVVLVVQS